MSDLLEAAIKDLRTALHKDSIHERPGLAIGLVQGALRKVTLARRRQQDLVPDPFDGTCWYCGTEGPPTHCIEELATALHEARIDRWVQVNTQQQVTLTFNKGTSQAVAVRVEGILKRLAGDKS